MDQLRRPALIVVDVQRGFDDPAHWGPRDNPACEDNIAALLALWRERSRPVVLVRHDSADSRSPLATGTPGNDFKDVITGEPDVLVSKTVNSSFHGTPDLHAWLQKEGIDRSSSAGSRPTTAARPPPGSPGTSATTPASSSTPRTHSTGCPRRVRHPGHDRLADDRRQPPRRVRHRGDRSGSSGGTPTRTVKCPVAVIVGDVAVTVVHLPAARAAHRHRPFRGETLSGAALNSACESRPPATSPRSSTRGPAGQGPRR